MTATVVINRYTGVAPGTPAVISSGNTVVNATDTHQTVAGGSNYPVKVPAGGTNYSYWCVTRLATTAKPQNAINNLRWYTDGSNNFGTGIGVNVGQATSYVRATGTQGETGTALNKTNYTSLTTAINGADGIADAFTKTTAAPLSVAGSVTGTAAFGNYVVYQVTVTNAASAGVHPTEVADGGPGPETFTWLYDET